MSGTNVVPLSTSSSSSPVGGGRGSAPGGSSGALVGLCDGGKKRPVPFGPEGSASSSTMALSVVVVVVSAAIAIVIAAAVVVVGGMVEGSVVDGSTAGASVRLIEGKVGGSGGAAVALGGPKRKTS